MTQSPHPLEVEASSSRAGLLALGSAALAVVAVLWMFVVVVNGNAPFRFEAAWMAAIADARSPLGTALALWLNRIGGGILAIAVVPVSFVVALLLWRRPWGALYLVAAELATTAIVQFIKPVAGRPRPEDIIVHSDFGSFPSGHSANAAVLAAVLGILFPRVSVWAVGTAYTVAMMLSRTYLGAHWITDTVAGALIGLAAASFLAALFGHALEREGRMPHPPPWRRVPRD